MGFGGNNYAGGYGLVKYVNFSATAVLIILGALWFSYERDKLKSIRSEVMRLAEATESMASGNHSSQKPAMPRRELLWAAPAKWGELRLRREDRIAHAGGAYNGETYTNSLEALDANKGEFTIFEIDLAFTSDDELVCSHDWDGYPKQIFGFDIGGVPSLSEFERLSNENPRFTNCTLTTLAKWMEENPEAVVVTDVKDRNIEALAHIAKKFPALVSRFIPQIYNMGEYDPARALGYEKVILTIYNWGASEIDIVEAVKGKQLFAITVPFYRAPYIGNRLKDVGHRVYAHTINSLETKNMLRWFGVDEIYTDTLRD